MSGSIRVVGREGFDQPYSSGGGGGGAVLVHLVEIRSEGMARFWSCSCHDGKHDPKDATPGVSYSSVASPVGVDSSLLEKVMALRHSCCCSYPIGGGDIEQVRAHCNCPIIEVIQLIEGGNNVRM